ncbi:TetR/AcrR family transcriptional regulator [Skermania piniformis]|uniref:TetR/AcrR family transcriptional regulator n=2 Tax=Skermania pinensis TaxID=39122 RepID=A0ABX8SE06_9ACTN|nr:TetR/AcrR family transcriptional regulator [Skermania piniformis]
MLSIGGLERISVEEIAAKAGISKGLLFHYFTSKQGYHLEIVRQAAQDLLDAIDPKPGLPPIDMLRDSIERYVDYVVANREAYVSQLRGPASADPEFVEIFEANRSEIVRRILTQVPLGVDEATRPTVHLAVRGWIAFIEETTIAWLRTQPISRADLVELNVRALPAVALTSEMAVTLE